MERISIFGLLYSVHCTAIDVSAIIAQIYTCRKKPIHSESIPRTILIPMLMHVPEPVERSSLGVRS